MTRIIVLGAGKIGSTCAHLLGAVDDYDVTLADRDGRVLASVEVKTRVVDARDADALRAAFAEHEVVINAGPFTLSAVVARAAKETGTHYFDLTEDVRCTADIKALAHDADSAFVPQCGLAPGFISIVAYDLAKKFDTLRDVRMRVGALPKYPTNALKYNLTWSTDGLINEYCNLCEAIVDGEKRELQPLGDVEHFSLDGIDYEAFNTSGGLGTLCDTLLGKVQNLDYKTVRYPGHREIMKILLRDLRLGLAEKRESLKRILEDALPVTLQDVALIFATVTGIRDGVLIQESYAKKIYSRRVNGHTVSAIQLTTASAVCTLVDLMRMRKIPDRGFVRQEEVELADFLANRFGKVYHEAADIETFAAV